MSKNGQHYRSSSYDSACHKTQISFKESNRKRPERTGSLFLQQQQADNDNITLVESESEKNEDEKFFGSSFLLYLDDIYSRYSPAVVLENKGNTARDHLGKI